MLILRNGQLRALRRVVNQDLKRRLLEHVERVFPEALEEMGKATVREWIEESLERAAAYDLTTEREVAAVLDMMFLVDYDFHTHPDHRELRKRLLARGGSLDERLDRVYEYAERLERT